MQTARAGGDQAASPSARPGRPSWVRSLGLVALTLLVVLALIAMEVLSLLLLDLLR